MFQLNHNIMKRIILHIALLLLPVALTGQSIDDAYRMSGTSLWGTARFIGMGGAFGALGGEFTALSYNPGGIGVIQRSLISFSPGLSRNLTEAEYLNNTTSDYTYNVGFSSLGTILAFQPKGGGMLKNVNVGLGYNKLNDFDQYTRIEAFNPSGSLVDYFFFNDYHEGGNINGTHPDDLDPFWERLAFDAYVIDTIPGTNYEYSSPVPYGVDMVKKIDTYGRNGELVVSLGANLMHRLYLGASLGIQSFSYRASVTHVEDWQDGEYNDYFSFMRELNTSATGYNFKMGFIYRPIDLIRIGAAFHTPTFFNVDDEIYNTMESSFVSGLIVPTDEEGYQLPSDYFNYRLITPFKAIVSMALQFGKVGMLSADYEYVDYSAMRFRVGDSEAQFDYHNDLIADTYRPVSNLRLGGEFKIGVFALRGGFAWYQSPYLEGLENDDAHTTSISAGLGIQERNYFIDLGFIRSNYGERHYLYEGETNGSFLENLNTRLVATVGFRF